MRFPSTLSSSSLRFFTTVVLLVELCHWGSMNQHRVRWFPEDTLWHTEMASSIDSWPEELLQSTNAINWFWTQFFCPDSSLARNFGEKISGICLGTLWPKGRIHNQDREPYQAPQANNTKQNFTRFRYYVQIFPHKGWETHSGPWLPASRLWFHALAPSCHCKSSCGCLWETSEPSPSPSSIARSGTWSPWLPGEAGNHPGTSLTGSWMMVEWCV